MDSEVNETSYPDEEDGDSLYASSGFNWPLLQACTTIITLILLIFSFSMNISTIFTICCSRHPRRYGYFHLLILFCLLNMFYFVLKSSYLVIDNLNLVGIDPGTLLMDISPIPAMITDILIWILGASLLLLTAMTIDCLSVHAVKSRPIQKCLRTFVGVFAIVISAGVVITTLIFKFNYIISDLDITVAARLLIVTSCYLLNFVLIPSFFIVIFGTVNWVTDMHSSRPIKAARKVERKLDHRICVLSIILLLLFLVYIIVDFSIDMKIHEDENEYNVTKIILEIINIFIDLLFALYPMIFVCGVGGFCCCFYDDYA